MGYNKKTSRQKRDTEEKGGTEKLYLNFNSMKQAIIGPDKTEIHIYRPGFQQSNHDVALYIAEQDAFITMENNKISLRSLEDIPIADESSSFVISWEGDNMIFRSWKDQSVAVCFKTVGGEVQVVGGNVNDSEVNCSFVNNQYGKLHHSHSS